MLWQGHIEQTFWEGANYVVALLALIAIGVVWNARNKREEPMELIAPAETSMEVER